MDRSIYRSVAEDHDAIHLRCGIPVVSRDGHHPTLDWRLLSPRDKGDADSGTAVLQAAAAVTASRKSGVETRPPCLSCDPLRIRVHVYTPQQQQRRWRQQQRPAAAAEASATAESMLQWRRLSPQERWAAAGGGFERILSWRPPAAYSLAHQVHMMTVGINRLATERNPCGHQHAGQLGYLPMLIRERNGRAVSCPRRLTRLPGLATPPTIHHRRRAVCAQV